MERLLKQRTDQGRPLSPISLGGGKARTSARAIRWHSASSLCGKAGERDEARTGVQLLPWIHALIVFPQSEEVRKKCEVR